MQRPISIDEFMLDPRNECLWKGDAAIPLRPKAFALLHYLVQNPGRILTKEELLEAVWPDAIVGDAVLKVCVRELRRALGDASTHSRFIETVHRRGYRWRAAEAPVGAEVARGGSTADSSGDQTLASKASRDRRRGARSGPLVQRDAELEGLQADLGRALEGERRLVFVTGEPGIGKTALCQRFIEELGSEPDLWHAKGQCLEHFGTGEAYLPVLEALTQLARGPGAAELRSCLRSLAPTWLAQLPILLKSDEERRSLERELLGATQGRMLREMCDALEELSRGRTLVFWLEDLHWADPSTVDLLGALARRQGPARLLFLATQRPVDLVVHDRPARRLVRDLSSRGMCRELRLERLGVSAAGVLVSRFLGGGELAPELGAWIHHRTHGNPLFALNLADSLRARGQIAEVDGRWAVAGPLDDEHVPESVLTLLEEAIERRDLEEQALLEAAAVGGREFGSAAVAAILEGDQGEIEERLFELARSSHLLETLQSSELPDGTHEERYRFSHALYVVALRRRIPATRLCSYHRRNAERGVRAYGSEVARIATELADQFERAQRPRQAAELYLTAAQECERRFALREAEQHLALALRGCEQAGGADDLRLTVLERIGHLRRTCGDFAAAAEVYSALASAAEHARRPEAVVQARLMEASATSWFGREACLRAIAGSEQALAALPDGLVRVHAEGAVAYWRLLWHGRTAEDADACERARAAAEDAGDRERMAFHTVRASWFRLLGGETQAANDAARLGVGLCVEQGDWSDYLLGQFFLAWSLLHLGSWGELRQVLAESNAMARRNGHTSWGVLFRMLEAWLRLEGRDFTGAHRLVAEVQLQDADLANPFIALFARTIGGLARQGVGETEGAQSDFERVLGPESDSVLMGWILRMVAGTGQARLCLNRGDLDGAEQHASRVCEVAEAAGERTASAVARRTLAEVAARRGERSTALEQLEQALAHLDGDLTPLAAWRVHLSAAELFAEDPARGRKHQEETRRLALQLAGSLPAHDPLRTTLTAYAERSVTSR